MFFNLPWATAIGGRPKVTSTKFSLIEVEELFSWCQFMYRCENIYSAWLPLWFQLIYDVNQWDLHLYRNNPEISWKSL